jgi:hypothetical protein
MKKRGIIVLCLLASLSLLSACDQKKQETSLITAFDQKGPHDTISQIRIEATSSLASPTLKHEEIAKQLEVLLSSGRYDIVSIHSHYRDEFLESVEVFYRERSRGTGNRIRASIIQSYEKDLDKKSEDVKGRVSHIVSTGGLDVVKVQTLMLKEQPLAAEIYFLKH